MRAIAGSGAYDAASLGASDEPWPSSSTVMTVKGSLSRSTLARNEALLAVNPWISTIGGAPARWACIS